MTDNGNGTTGMGLGFDFFTHMDAGGADVLFGLGFGYASADANGVASSSVTLPAATIAVEADMTDWATFRCFVNTDYVAMASHDGGDGSGPPGGEPSGGGGAGAVGVDATPSKAGNGGAGRSSSITGSAVTRAGGGGGGANAQPRQAYGGGPGPSPAGGGGNGGWGQYNEWGQKEVGSKSEGKFSDELQELIHNFGIEYWPTELLAVRAGYVYDEIGEINNLTYGFGIRFAGYGFDFSYLNGEAGHPLTNTLRFSLNKTFK